MIFGSGGDEAGIMVIGDFPSITDEKRNKVFSDKTGKFVREVIRRAGFNPSQIYFTNAVKCRTPANRQPTIIEISKCTYLMQEDILFAKRNIDIIITLGSTALISIIGEHKPLSKIHGKIQKKGRFEILPMYHPSYALNNADIKIEFIKDWIFIAEYYKKFIPWHSHTLNTF